MLGVYWTCKDGTVTLIDRDWQEHMVRYTWRKDRQGYVRRATGGRSIYLHREVVNAFAGEITDHANGDKLDNRACNLRVGTRRDNNCNVAPRSKSGYKGVYHQPAARLRPWVASITVEGRTVNLGNHATAIEAAQAYNEAAKRYHGKFARLNELPKKTEAA